MMTKKQILSIGFFAVVVLCGILTKSMIETNFAGYYKIRQMPVTGTLDIFYNPGMFGQYGGKITEYKKEGTYSFIIPVDQDMQPVEMITADGKKITIQQSVINPSDEELLGSTNSQALPVRYNDGGTGHIYGKIRFRMPADSGNDLKIHNAFRSYNHTVESLIKVTAQNVMNLTASLMSSEESYTTAKEKFQRWAEDQMINGPYKTKLVTLKVSGESGRTEEVQRATIMYKDDDQNEPMHGKSPFKEYGVTVTQCQIVNWTYEPKTLEQIQRKREALMAIVQAKAEAEKAEQIKITAEAQGQANVMAAKYSKEVEKVQAVVDAQKIKEVAVINATQLVEVAQQVKLEAEQKKLAATEYKMEQILRGEGDAKRKQMVLQADGALEQKLTTYESVMSKAFEELSKQKWVPEVQINNAGAKGNEANVLIDLFTAKVLKDLGLDMTIVKKTSSSKE
jgi:hypothetical protein